MINGGFKVNALPSTVSATINLRCILRFFMRGGILISTRVRLSCFFFFYYSIGLGDTSASVLQHLRNVINDDRIQVGLRYQAVGLRHWFRSLSLAVTFPASRLLHQ